MSDNEDMFGLAPKKKKDKKINVVDKLHETPIKDKKDNMPTFQQIDANICQQADLLFMPDDRGFKYALVVADIGGKRLVDAEPIQNKAQADVLSAFKKIYKRGILKIPSNEMEVDAGSEFGGIVKDWFVFGQDHHIKYRVAKPGRHRMQGIVERKNQIIAKALFRRMSAQELLTGEVSKDWVDDLPKLIKILNARNEKKKIKKEPEFPDPKCAGKSCDLLEEGQKVRVQLDEPRESLTTGKKLHGKFRSTDIRWDPKERVIKRVVIKPGMPPAYLLDGKDTKSGLEAVGYTKNQLQVIDKKEVYPDKKVIRGKPKTYIIEEIIGKTRIKGKIYFKVKWRGFTETTLEPRSELIKDQPKLIKDYEKT
jgi:hypothetical protein